MRFRRKPATGPAPTLTRLAPPAPTRLISLGFSGRWSGTWREYQFAACRGRHSGRREGGCRVKILGGRGNVWAVGLVLELLAIGSSFPVVADEPGARLRPLVRQYCVGCHDGDEPEAGLDLEAM